MVNVVFTAGDANRGVQTAAFNLPNDERVVKEKGTKRVMLKNVQEAKFDKVLLPIAGGGAARRRTARTSSFDAFFTHILMHELMHGLGPHNITVGGRATTVRQELKETYSALEEAKADISGLWALQYLVDKGVLDKAAGAHDVHDLPGLRLPLHPLRPDRGARRAASPSSSTRCSTRARSRCSPDGTFAVDRAKIKEAVASADPRDHDHPGRGRLREGASELLDDDGGGAPAGAARARPPEGGAGGHRAALHRRGRARALTVLPPLAGVEHDAHRERDAAVERPSGVAGQVEHVAVEQRELPVEGPTSAPSAS